MEIQDFLRKLTFQVFFLKFIILTLGLGLQDCSRISRMQDNRIKAGLAGYIK